MEHGRFYAAILFTVFTSIHNTNHLGYPCDYASARGAAALAYGVNLFTVDIAHVVAGLHDQDASTTVQAIATSLGCIVRSQRPSQSPSWLVRIRMMPRDRCV